MDAIEGKEKKIKEEWDWKKRERIVTRLLVVGF